MDRAMTPKRSTETERKFRIDADQPIPELGEVVTLGKRKTYQLSAVYYDTPDLLLARNRRTLRRRTGGHDSGWHLKLPGDGDSRTEMQLPLTTGSRARLVPEALRAQVAEVIGEAPLIPVVELRTRRTEIQLTGPRGGSLAVLCDDTVTATRRGTEESWRELEVELTRGDEELLERVTEVLAAGGVPVSASVSKLVQAMGERLAEAEEPPRPRKASTARVLGDYLATQVGVLQALEPQVRAGEVEPVHQVRVATRRLRSTLRTFRSVLDREVTDPLRDELKWYAGLLGATRDPAVLAELLRAEVADLPASAVVGSVDTQLDRALAEQQQAAHQQLLAAMDSPRYARLGTALMELIAEPPFGEYAGARAKGALPEFLERADRRVLKAWKKARKSEDEASGPAWHLVRKQAKAARYAWEAAAPTLGADAAEIATAWKRVTQTLGIAQDCALVREQLPGLAAAATAARQSAFTHGVLFQLQSELEETARADGVQALRAARKLIQG
ncbi:hypothetical protein CGZ95_18160 [Enemella evansiae]|nr:hypothetical protein CGZ95_18160 [Enemella evansiae]